MKIDLSTVRKLLDEVDKEYTQRYAWGDDDRECIALFHKIRYKIEEEISLAYKDHKTLSVDKVLDIVDQFGNKWQNSPTECNDTDGKIHISSIYDKLASAFSYNDNPDTKNKNIYIWIIYIILVLFSGFLLLQNHL